MLLAVVLQQLAEAFDFLTDDIGLDVRIVVERLQGAAPFAERLLSAGRTLFQHRQFFATLVQPRADQHDLLQARAIGRPRLAQRIQPRAVLQLSGDQLQARFNLTLLLGQLIERSLSFVAGLLGAARLFADLLKFGVQMIELDLLLESLVQPRPGVLLIFLGLLQAVLCSRELAFQVRQRRLGVGLLLSLLLNACSQRRQLRVELLALGKQMPLRRQAFQLTQLLAFSALLVPGLLRAVELFTGRQMAVAQTTQLTEPLLLQLQLTQLRLCQLQLLLCVVEALLQLGALLGLKRRQVAGLGIEGF